MAILQALLAFLTKSAGKIVNAVFGWAVLALFGPTSPKEQALLSALVGAAAAWPLLLLGVIFPRIALFAISFVPMAKSVPSLWLRLVWVALALAVPFLVGGVVARRSPPGRLPETGVRKVLRGFPITLAIASAFLLLFFITPVLRVITILKRKEYLHVPGVMARELCPEVMIALSRSLAAHGIDELQEATPPWHMRAPSRVLLKLGGAAFANLVTERIEYRRNADLEVAVLPNETQLRGPPAQVARAHALCIEVFAPRLVIQSFNAEAQDLERQLKRVWSIYQESPRRHRESKVLRGRIDDVSRVLAEKNLPWDEWQTVYRLSLQLDRALAGETPLLDHASTHTLRENNHMANENTRQAQLALPGPGPVTKPLSAAVPVSPAAMSNRELLTHIAESATLLAKKQLELAKSELRADVKREVSMVKGLSIGGLCALFTVNLMLVACALALGTLMPEWAAALVVAGAVLAVGTVAGLVGWGKRVKQPLEATRRTLKEDATWARERLA